MITKGKVWWESERERSESVFKLAKNRLCNYTENNYTANSRERSSMFQKLNGHKIHTMITKQIEELVINFWAQSKPCTWFSLRVPTWQQIGVLPFRKLVSCRSIANITRTKIALDHNQNFCCFYQSEHATLISRLLYRCSNNNEVWAEVSKTVFTTVVEGGGDK